jgi:hypothetical protein
MINAHVPNCLANRVRTLSKQNVADIFDGCPEAGDLGAAVSADYLNCNLTFRDHLLLYGEAGLASVGSRLLLWQVSREAGSRAPDRLTSLSNGRYRTGRPESS